MVELASADRTGARLGGAAQRAAGFSLIYLVAMAFLIPDVISINLGSIRLPPIRAILFATALPVIMIYMTRADIKPKAHDWLFFGFVCWTVLCMAMNRGLGGYQTFGSFFVEYAVMYMAVSVFVTGAGQIRRFMTITFGVIAVLGALAAVESFSYSYLLMNLAKQLIGEGGRYVIFSDSDQTVRLGLWRATSVFSHPILYGLFCAVFFSFAWYLNRGGARLATCAVIAGAVFFSLSAGPMLGLILQMGFIAVEATTRGVKGRAPVILWSVGLFLLAVQVVAESGVYRLVQIVALDPGSAWYRRLIWTHSWDDIMRNPIFGMLPEHWEKPFWMTPSLDNQWVIYMMNGGLPAFVLLVAALLTMMRSIFRKPDSALSDDLAMLRRAWVASVFAMALVGATVAFFDKMPPLFAMLLGFGAVIDRLIAAAPAPGDAFQAPPRRRRVDPVIG